MKEYAREFISIKKGDWIARPQEIVSVSSTARFTRKSLKHFIESRVAHGNSWDDIEYLLENACEISEIPQLEITNPNQRNYPGSFLLGSYYKDKKKAVVIILDKGKSPRSIISLHFAKRKAFLRISE